jgi:hypothetical protein
MSSVEAISSTDAPGRRRREKPPPTLDLLLERFDHDAIDVTAGRARIRL